ncbi:MAG TPA: hypothetical protein VFT64_00070 [Rickettsiales bacterium]|nr:hypothetical protein [Rickettsiales bacterium]
MRYTKLLLLLTVATFFGSASAYAEDDDSPFKDASDYTPPHKANTYSVGVEGFHDVYREPGPDLDVTDTTNYGSITGSWKHYMPMLENNQFMVGVDARYSQGKDSYHSVSGSSSGARQQEFDGRLLTGLEYNNTLHGSLTPYIGLGLRYFVDNGKGTHTDTGAFGYDRRITQGYAPIGITYSYISDSGWSLTPNFEFDALMRGNVNTRLPNGGGFYRIGSTTYKAYNIDNTQDAGSGFGLRGSLMLGWSMGNLNFETGPFIRYWKINTSETTFDPNGIGWIEPNNTRIQVGGAFKVLW